jgi:hypothetical protein
MKRLLLTLFGAIAALFLCAAAIASDMTLSTCVEHKGAKTMCGSFSWYGLDAVSAQNITARGMNMLDAGSKLQDKGGDFTIRMTGNVVDDNGKSAAIPEIELRGVTFRGVNQFLRVQQKHADALIGYGELMEKGGKRKHFGKQ